MLFSHIIVREILLSLQKRFPHPALELPVRQKTRFRTEAKTIHWGPSGVVSPNGSKAVLVETSSGERFTADFVVVTVSLGVLKENATTMFNPPLNDRKIIAIQVKSMLLRTSKFQQTSFTRCFKFN